MNNLVNSIDNYFIELTNNYMKYYRLINNNNDIKLFDGLSDYDKTITNDQLESFYKELKKYKDDKFYEYDKKSEEKYEYGIFKNDELILVSNSLFALLLEITNLEFENKKNNLYKIKKL